MKQVPPTMTTSIAATIISSLVSLVVGLVSGGFAGYNGWKKNQIDASAARVQAEESRLSKEAIVNQSTSALISDALSLVKSLREEIERLHSENAELRKRLEDVQGRLDRLEAATAIDHAPATQHHVKRASGSQNSSN